MSAYCEIKNFRRDAVSFYFNGREILDTDTPLSIGLKESDKIFVCDRLLENCITKNKKMGKTV